MFILFYFFSFLQLKNSLLLQIEYGNVEKYNQMEDENASDTSEKSKTGLGTPEKKGAGNDSKKEEASSSTPPASSSTSATKNDAKQEDGQDSDIEDPHGKILKTKSSLFFYCKL